MNTNFISITNSCRKPLLAAFQTGETIVSWMWFYNGILSIIKERIAVGDRKPALPLPSHPSRVGRIGEPGRTV